jgi:hypothetical protein
MTKDLELVSATGPPNVKALFEMTLTPMYGSRMGVSWAVFQAIYSDIRWMPFRCLAIFPVSRSMDVDIDAPIECSRRGHLTHS